jgi:hypothetical protein
MQVLWRSADHPICLGQRELEAGGQVDDEEALGDIVDEQKEINAECTESLWSGIFSLLGCR